MHNGSAPRDPLPLEPPTAEELERVERAVLARGETLENLDWLAFMFYSHGKLEKARDYYVRLCARAPDNASYHYYLGELLWQAEDRSGAREQWERVMQLDRAEYAAAAARRLAGP